MAYLYRMIFILFLLTTIITTTYSQLNFENITIDEAMIKAKETGKIILANYVSASCDNCDEVSNKNFSVTSLNQFVLQKCIPVRISLNSKDRQKFIEEYNPGKKIGIYFISGDGELIHVFAGVLTMDMPDDKKVEFYTFQIQKAYSNLAEGRASLKELDEEWQNNPGNIPAMELNLNRRNSLGLRTDSLLDEYVKRIPPDSLASDRTILFLLRLAPNLFSKANNVARNNQPSFPKIWLTMDLPTRVEINRKIISSSMKIAISQKDMAKAKAVAKFCYNTYDNNNVAGRSYYNQLLKYFIGVNDTINSLSLYSYFITNYYITISNDSLLAMVKQKDKEYRNHVLMLHEDTSSLNDSLNYKINYNEVMQSHASTLNNAAWFIYLKSQNPKYLTEALNFVERANSFYETANSLDTYGRLLYKTGNATKAIEVQKKAVIQLEKENFDTTNFVNVLEKMKKGEPL